MLTKGHRLTERSSWSRKQRILEVGNVSHDEALEYLRLRGIDKKLATDDYALVGGRIVLLQYAANNIEEGLKLESMYPYRLDNWILTPFSRNMPSLVR
jgi:hypothetical protein